MNLNNFRLHLGNKNATCFNFYQGVAPVLTACGQTLKKLVLEDFTEIDVQQVKRAWFLFICRLKKKTYNMENKFHGKMYSSYLKLYINLNYIKIQNYFHYCIDRGLLSATGTSGPVRNNSLHTDSKCTTRSQNLIWF